MTALEPYSAYKDSGSAWLGSVPAAWSTVPVRQLVEEIRQRNDQGQSGTYLSLMANVGVLLYEDKGDVGNKKPEDLDKCKKVAIGDLVINSMNYGIGSYGISPYDGVCSPVYIVLRAKPGAVIPDYVKRIFEVKEFQRLAQSFGNGILEHRRAISWGTLKNLPLAAPSVDEQRLIAAFLNHETAEIDAFVADQQELVRLLNERRVATITQAITKGLNPTVSLKDSGVKWLGEVPENWQIMRLRQLVSFKNGSDYKDVEVSEGGHPVYGSGGEFRRASTYLFDGDSVLFGRKGTVDKPLLVTGKFWTVDTMFYTSIDPRLLARFLYYFATTIPYKYFSTSTALPSMTQTDLGSIFLPLPPRLEQQQIGSYLDRETAEIDAAIADAKEAIELSKERRAVLISAAVTGKIDVRDHPAAKGHA